MIQFSKNHIYHGNALDVLKSFPSKSINQCITSPPYYGLREYNAPVIWDSIDTCIHDWKIGFKKWHNDRYGLKSKAVIDFRFQEEGTLHYYCRKCSAWKGELGHEPTPEMFISHLVTIFNEVKRVLTKDGSLWVVIGDTFADKLGGLMMIPERFAIAMQNNGWLLFGKIVWNKKNGMPQSAKRRPTLNYEFVYFFTKSKDYYFKTMYRPYSETTLKEIGELYNGQGTKDYENNNVQNPSNVKRNIIKSLGKTKEIYETKYDLDNQKHIITELIDSRKESRLLATQLFTDKQKQQKFINLVHDNRNIINTKIKFGGNKVAGGQNATYSGKEWIPSEFGSLERSVWDINTQASDVEHYAVYPDDLIRKIIDAGCPLIDSRKRKGTILDPFIGSGTTALVAMKMKRYYIGIEAVKLYYDIAIDRINFIKNIVTS